MRPESYTTAVGRTGKKGWEARVTGKQLAAIQRALTGQQFEVDDLSGYVATGDAAHCSPETMSRLQAAVKAAKTGLTESQAKRIWPRKVAAVALIHNTPNR